MNATLRTEMKPVTRQRFGTVWCPFCDRSRQEIRATPFCDGCGAEFTAGSPIIVAPIDNLDKIDEQPRRSRGRLVTLP